MLPYSEIKLRIPLHCQHRHKTELSFTRFFKIYLILKFCTVRVCGHTLVKKSSLPFPLPGNKITHISMDYLLKSEWFHWGSELVLRLTEPCIFTWETRWPIFYIFVCKRGAAQSLVPYRFPQVSDCFFLSGFFFCCFCYCCFLVLVWFFLWYEYSYYYY